MDKITLLTKKIVKFRSDRDWKQFHNFKDMSLSLILEAAELMEHFQWKNAEEIDNYVKKHKKEISEELADILYWVLIISYDLKIDISKEFIAKLKKNEKKYPINKSKGKHTKYKELQ